MSSIRPPARRIFSLVALVGTAFVLGCGDSPTEAERPWTVVRVIETNEQGGVFRISQTGSEEIGSICDPRVHDISVLVPGTKLRWQWGGGASLSDLVVGRQVTVQRTGVTLDRCVGFTQAALVVLRGTPQP